MILFSIDPGPEESAYIIMDSEKIVTAAKVPTGALIQGLATMSKPDAVACEHLQCFGMSVGKEVFETAYHIGAIRQVCAYRGIPFHRIYRSDEKMALCHSMRAKDENIRQAIIDRYGGKDRAIGKKANPGPLYKISGDMWSALAVAITFADKNNPAYAMSSL